MTGDMLETATAAARAGGEILLQWRDKFTVSEKSRKNLVTEADFASQEAIFKLIQERYPDHGFLGEEGLNHRAGGCSFRWVIDPLDGTSNYVHGFPYYAVSIGLEDEHGLLLGTIFDPNRDEMFTAIRGEGACLNEKPIRSSEITRLDEAMCLASLPVNVSRDDPAIERFLTVLEQAQTVQRSGSAALNLACVACGRFEAFWSTSLKPWDMAAGALIVTEAGGQVSTIRGSEFAIEVPDILASNGESVHSGLTDIFRRTGDQ